MSPQYSPTSMVRRLSARQFRRKLPTSPTPTSTGLWVIAWALEEGATDYIVKPLSPTELVARVRAALRRFEEPRGGAPAGPFLLGELAVDY